MNTKMEFKQFIRQRRLTLGMSQLDLANKLSEAGHEASPARISHWETGRNKPPIEDAGFRRLLAHALDMDINEMMAELGYVQGDFEHTPEARRAAEIVDLLSPEDRDLALGLLKQLLARN
jgi:transcriptional regulator with XRE-family HTH domain